MPLTCSAARLAQSGIDLGGRYEKATRALLRAGSRLFVVSLHSSVILPGATPFARTEAEVESLLGRLHGYLKFFMCELGGKPSIPGEVLLQWSTRASADSSLRSRVR